MRNFVRTILGRSNQSWAKEIDLHYSTTPKLLIQPHSENDNGNVALLPNTTGQQGGEQK